MRLVRLVILPSIVLLSLLAVSREGADAADGSISGTVTAEGGSPIQGASVNAQAFDGCCGGNALSDSDGNYTIVGLAPDEYRVVAAASGFVFELYDNTIDFALATPVTVGSGADTPVINFELSTGGGISGVVTREGGGPLEGVFVEASLYTGCCSNGSAITASDGSYTILGLAPGSYRAYAYTSPASPADGEFYDDTTDPFAATAVAVSDGTITPAIDFALPGGGSISGAVRDEIGNPIEGATVDALSASGCCAVAVATTDASGAYTVGDLPAGSYRLFASATGFASEYYDDVVDPDLTTAVSVTEGADTSGIDLALAACTTSWPSIDGDDDCDGYTTAIEEFVGTDPMSLCDDGAEPSDWPPDIDDSRTVDMNDLLGDPVSFKQSFGATDPGPNYIARFDLSMDGTINANDLLGVPNSFKSTFGMSCAP